MSRPPGSMRRWRRRSWSSSAGCTWSSTTRSCSSATISRWSRACATAWACCMPESWWKKVRRRACFATLAIPIRSDCCAVSRRSDGARIDGPARDHSGLPADSGVGRRPLRVRRIAAPTRPSDAAAKRRRFRIWAGASRDASIPSALRTCLAIAERRGAAAARARERRRGGARRRRRRAHAGAPAAAHAQSLQDLPGLAANRSRRCMRSRSISAPGRPWASWANPAAARARSRSCCSACRRRTPAARSNSRASRCRRAPSDRTAAQLKALQIVFQNPGSALNRSQTVRRLIGRSLRLEGLYGPGEGSAAQGTRGLGAPDGAPSGREAAPALRRIEAARRHRPRFRRRSAGGGVRRADLRARCIGAIGDPEPAGRSAERSSRSATSSSRTISTWCTTYPTASPCSTWAGCWRSVPPSRCSPARITLTPRRCCRPIPVSRTRRARRADKRIRLSGELPSALNLPSGCVFHTRCPRKLGEICERQEPPLHPAGEGHAIRCHIPAAELERAQTPRSEPKPRSRAVSARAAESRTDRAARWRSGARRSRACRSPTASRRNRR